MVYAVLREAILSATLEPGAHLRQDEIAEMVGVSRMPVRSALLQLEADGLVDFTPHRGAIVRSLGTAEIREIYEVRAVLETYALRKGIKTMDQDRFEELERLATALDEETDGERFIQLRIDFYEKLYDGERNPVLFGMIQHLRNNVGRYWLRLRVVQGKGHLQGHRRIVELLREGDAIGAEHFLGEHLRSVAEELVEVMGSADPDSAAR